MKQTFAIIKPDAVKREIQYQMLDYIESKGFKVRASRHRMLTDEEVRWLYREHEGKDFFEGQVEYMLSGPVVILSLQGLTDDTPTKFRELMGPTDRTKAPEGTLRAKYAISYRENSIHGSDGEQAACDELDYFFGANG